VEILEETEDYRLGKLFRIIRARLKHRLFNGRMSEPISRINFERGNSVGVLLHDPENDTVILVRQFRYPVYAGLDPAEREGDQARSAWILETVAGMQDPGSTAREVANKELLEEAGYRVQGGLQPIASIYPSPGGSSERIALFLGEVHHSQRVGDGGGVEAEGEDIEVVAIPFAEAMAMIGRGEIRDAKAIIALQHLALRKAGAGQSQ
jgi:ADP-ribose pyrophosphatase